MKNKLLAILSFFLFFFAGITPSYAAQAHVSTTYNVTYTVNQEGITHAVFQAALVNQTSDYYVSTYSLQVGFTDVEHVRASDGLGPVQTDLQQNSNGYLITLHFNQ